MKQNLKLIKSTIWEEVFFVWKANEGSDPVWQKFAVEEKGYPNWEEWRQSQANEIDAADREWKIYEMINPTETIPQFLMGPFKGWQQHYEEKNVHTFADLVRDHREWVKNNIGVQARLNNFPEETEFIGIHLPENDQIVLFEGHHRAAAVALAVAEDNPISFANNPTIALTEISGEEAINLKKAFDKRLKENPEVGAFQ